MKTNTLALMALIFLPLISFSKKTEHRLSVFFETDKHQINSDFREALFEYVNKHASSGDFEIVVEGHADHRGNLSYNDSLSQRRAREVRSFLMDYGIAPELIELSFYGERKPRKRGGDRNSLSKNRRVDVLIRKYSFQTIQDLQDALKENSVSSFTIDPNDKHKLRASGGSEVIIASNSFVTPEGTRVEEEVVFTMTEGLTLEDWMAHDLSTRSGDELLVSGGMIKLEARTVSGKQVVLDSTQPIVVNLPSDSRNASMQLFNSPRGENWSTTESSEFFEETLDLPPAPRLKRYSNDVMYAKTKVPKPPKPPLVPRKPTEPHEPREVDINRGIKWYTWNKRKKRAANMAFNENQWARYEQRLKRYQRNMSKWRVANKKYNEQWSVYTESLRAWRDTTAHLRGGWISWSNDEKSQTELDSLNRISREAYRQSIEEWKEMRDKKMAELAHSMDSMGIATADAVNNYIFATNELSWINVDRFYHLDKSEKRTVIVKAEPKEEVKVLLVFDDINSNLLMTRFDNGDFSQKNVPYNESATIYAFKVEDSRPWLAQYSLSPNDKKVKLKYQPSSFAEIKRVLSRQSG